MEISCTVPNCPFVGDDLNDFCYHLRRVHAYLKNYKFTCSVEGCGVCLSSIHSVRSHFLHAHPNLCEPNVHEARHEQQEQRIEEVHNNGNVDFVEMEEENPQLPETQLAVHQFSSMMSTLRSQVPSVFLRLQYKHRIQSSVARRIHEDYMSLFRLLGSGTASSLSRYASALHVEDTTFRAMLQCREVEEMCRTSTHKEAEQLRNLGYVQPIEVDLRVEQEELEAEGMALFVNPLEAVEVDVDDVEAVMDEADRRDNGGYENCDEVDDGNESEAAHLEQDEMDSEPDMEQEARNEEEQSKDVYHYVSIPETLAAYLKHDDVVAEIRAGPSVHQGDGTYDDYTSGSAYRGSEVQNRGIMHLRIVLYTDEITVTNPLQGHSKNHKLAAVYFLVQNIAAESQSSLCSIHLVALCKWTLVQKYSYAVFFHRIITDMNRLDNEGLDVVTLSGQRIHFTASLVAVSADNLSAHALGGFRCTFSSGRICRFCLISHENMRWMTSENDPQCALRTVENVRRHALAAGGDVFYQRMYGLAGESCLYSLPNFSPATHLPPDILHDILECFMPCHVRNLLRALNKRPAVYRFAAARKAIGEFRYKKADSKNKPPNFPTDWASQKKGIGGTAAEKWNLFRLLPFMIGEFIPEDNRHWHLYKLGLKITEIVLSFNATDDMLDELSNLIHDHHQLWVELYPDSFPCKFHYLIHYPRLFRMYGALRRLWTTRFESFHRYVKDILLKCKNFINETKTASERFQKMRCLQYHEGCGLPSKIDVTGSSDVCTLGTIEPVQARHCVSQLLRCGDEEILTKVTQVKYKGQSFYPGCYTIVALQQGGVPLFFKTLVIYIVENTVVLYGCAVTTIDFLDHYQAYEVEEREDEVLALSASDVASNQTLASYVVGGRQLIRCRFRPVVD